MTRIGFPEITAPGTATMLVTGWSREIKAAKLFLDQHLTNPEVTVRVAEVARSPFGRVQVRITLAGAGPAYTDAVATVLSLDHA